MSWKNNRCSYLNKNYPDEIKYFKEEWISKNITIPSENPDIKKICDIFVNPIIKKNILIDTKDGISNEGQCLSGKKFIIELLIETKMNYISNDFEQSLISTNFEIFKTIFIVIPNKINSKHIRDLYISSRLTFTPFVEHIHLKEITPRCCNLNILLLVDTQIC